MKNNKKSNHHYLPQFYLRYWANDNHKVWVYELNPSDENRRRPNPSLVHTKKVCSEYDLYSIGEDVSIEEWMDRNIENYCEPAFHKVINREHIDENDIFYIKSFLALTMARHPLVKPISGFHAAIAQHQKRTQHALLLNKLQPQDLNLLLNEMQQAMINYQPNPPKSIEDQQQMNFVQTIRMRLEVNLITLAPLNLQVLYIPTEIEASFITSDIPFYIVEHQEKEVIFDGNEVAHPIIDYVWFATSPKTLVFLSKDKNTHLYEEIVDVNRITNINSEIALSNKVIIANTQNVYEIVHRTMKAKYVLRQRADFIRFS